MENSGRLTWVRLQQPHEQCYPFLTVRAVFSCVQAKVGLRSLTCDHILQQAIAHEGCTDTVGESKLKVDSGRKLPCRTEDSTLGGVPVRRSVNWATSPPYAYIHSLSLISLAALKVAYRCLVCSKRSLTMVVCHR